MNIFKARHFTSGGMEFDGFYLRKKLVDHFSDIAAFEKYVSAYANHPYVRGFLYFIETIINQTIGQMEYLITDNHTYDLVHGGNIDSKNDELKLARKKSKDLQYIAALEVIRRELCQIRLGKKQDMGEISNIISKLKKTFEETYSYYEKKFSPQRAVRVDEFKKLSAAIGLHLGYIEYGWNFNLNENGSAGKRTPAFPAETHYHIMSGEAAKNYHLSNSAIVSFNDEYLLGYKLCLLYSYALLSPKKEVSEALLNATSWEEIHQASRRVYDSFCAGDVLMDSLFIIKECSSYRNAFSKKIIRTPHELNYVLRRRQIRLIEDEHEGDYPNTRALFKYVFFGMLRFATEKNKLEIIEFRKKNPLVKGETVFSYALYSSVGGGFWNSSHWLIFDNIDVDNKWESASFQPSIVRTFNLNKARIAFRTYAVDENLFRLKLREFSVAIRQRDLAANALREAKALLVELIGIYYVRKKIDGDCCLWREQISGTDIDGFSLSKDEAFIIQSKTTLPSEEKEIRKTLQNLSTAEAYLRKKHPSIRIWNKILFTYQLPLEEEQMIKKIESAFLEGGAEVVVLERLMEHSTHYPAKILDMIFHER